MSYTIEMNRYLRRVLHRPSPRGLCRCMLFCYTLIALGSSLFGPLRPLVAQSLEAELTRMPTAELAALAKEQGDASRGALVFFGAHLACSKCHATGSSVAAPLGPDLANLAGNVTDEALVESVLAPSKVIREGYASTTIVTTQGKTIAALIVERNDKQLVLRDIQRPSELLTLAAGDIDEMVASETSIMPSGQINQLASRQQFLDLMKYLMEVRDGGAARAKELQPPLALIAPALPEYEKHLDHAGLIRDWNAEAFQRGEAIYRRVCANCHGTKEQVGSLPTSLRFAEGKFKNGSDPLAMYRTLTHGFGLMPPQTWMVPSQKYDVIHYIREAYLRPHNRNQLIEIDAAYLTQLPPGNTRGPAPSTIEAWSAMDYGPSLTHTYEIPGLKNNFAYKGIAVRLDGGAGGVSRGKHWMVFDTDTLRMAAAWSAQPQKASSNNFINWRGIQFNGEHQIHPSIVGEVTLANSVMPGWAEPSSGSFLDEQRVLGRDGRRYGPLPRAWGKFQGVYYHGQQVVLSYSIGEAKILESPRLLEDEATTAPVFLRTINIGPRSHELILQVAQLGDSATEMQASEGSSNVVTFRSAKDKGELVAGFAPSNAPLAWFADGANLRVRIPAGEQPLKFTVWTTSPAPRESSDQNSSPPKLTIPDAASDLAKLTSGGPPRWPQKLETQAVLGSDDGPFAVDSLTLPEANPWLAQLRMTGLDFFADGRIAVCSWDGDVWIVEQPSGGTTLRWQRIASGLFQPLGLKIINDRIHVTCRDQLAALHDLNGDGEIDFYQCLNNDHQVTEHFHEFAMGLQADAAGNFYYAKSARHAKTAIVPQHGTLLRVSRDGSRTDILANGFRAANGVCLNPDGSFVVTDQEGHWNPKNRINWVTLNENGKPNFYGNMFGYHDVTDSSDEAMVPPLCWITNSFDRSPAELLWVSSKSWGPLDGSLLNLSYGYGKVFLVPHEKVAGQMQGGMIELPLPTFPTGLVRGRFHPGDGHLYLCGMVAWASSVTQPGGLFRLRATGQPMNLPVAINATKSGLSITFTDPIDPKSVTPENFQLKSWSLKRTANYGSKHFDEHAIVVRSAKLLENGKVLKLEIPDIEPTWCMEIKYQLLSATGKRVSGVVNNTIHRLSEAE